MISLETYADASLPSFSYVASHLNLNFTLKINFSNSLVRSLAALTIACIYAHRHVCMKTQTREWLAPHWHRESGILFHLHNLFSPAGNRDLEDLYSFDPVTMAWTTIVASSIYLRPLLGYPFESGSDDGRPIPRSFHGFTSAGGKLYVHGGESNRGVCVPVCVCVCVCVCASKSSKN